MFAFDNTDLSIQRMKNSFIYTLWSWSRVFVNEAPMPFFSFMDWLGSK